MVYISQLYLAHENLADSDPVVISYKVINRILPYLILAQGHCPPTIRASCIELIPEYDNSTGLYREESSSLL